MWDWEYVFGDIFPYEFAVYNGWRRWTYNMQHKSGAYDWVQTETIYKNTVAEELCPFPERETLLILSKKSKVQIVWPGINDLYVN